VGGARTRQASHRAAGEHNREDAIRRELKAMFKDTQIQHSFDDLTDDEIDGGGEELPDRLHFGSPVFDGARETEIKALLKQAGLPESGKCDMFDGMTAISSNSPLPLATFTC